MEIEVKTKQIGGSMAIIIPKEVVEKERLRTHDTVRVKITKVDNLDSLWGTMKQVKKSTSEIMKEIDEGEE